MIENLFTTFSNMLNQGAAWPLVAAFAWGVMSIVLSPCHLASIPLVVAYVNRGQASTTGRAFGLSALFAAGIFLSTVAIGIVTALLGRMLGDVGPWGKYLVAVVFLVFGLVLLGVISLPWSSPDMTGKTKTGLAGALGLGLLFGAAVGPCTFAYMAPLLAIVFDAAGERFAYSTGLILLYSVGHCGLIVAAGTAGAKIQHVLNWQQQSKLTQTIRRTCGVALLLIGLYLIWKA